MNSERGQASILFAIIFQVLFIFFAMVINVGLLIHDKINLQNSADIAAYYGAMKQAEVLNAMAHVNYQVRQSWKLLNWRLWALGDAGRNTAYYPIIANRRLPMDDSKARWNDKYDGPAVCVVHPLWFENRIQNNKLRDGQDLCKDPDLNVAIPPIPLRGIQNSPIFRILFDPLRKRSAQNAKIFTQDCVGGGKANYVTAVRFVASYKETVRRQRRAMQSLQKLLISGKEFGDLTANPVSATALKVFQENLTLPNRNGNPQFEMINSLYGKPFMVPIEVRLFFKYLDLYGDPGKGSCKANLKIIKDPPANVTDPDIKALVPIAQQLTDNDFNGTQLVTAEQFNNETENARSSYNSLVGFEKNPWIMAYVSVTATAHPKMLFSPFNGTVEIKAESYAMPFGGKMGPWYGNEWQPNAPFSGGNPIDKVLPPRIGASGLTNPLINPNYSRYPGDTLGMYSALARTIFLKLVENSNPRQLPQLQVDDYYNVGDPDGDPVVYSKAQKDAAGFRQAEIAALAPDLFDAAYYSIWPHMTETARDHLNKICQGQCYDFGTNYNSKPPQNSSVQSQISVAAKNAERFGGTAYWIIRNLEDVNSSWSQTRPDEFTEVPVGKKVTEGGRSGYSVKIVSRRFLTRPDLPLGGQSSTGAIRNPPP